MQDTQIMFNIKQSKFHTFIKKKLSRTIQLFEPCIITLRIFRMHIRGGKPFVSIMRVMPF